MRTTLKLGCILAVIALGSTVQAANIVAKETVKSDWFEHRVTWTEGAPSYVARWKALVRNNVVIVCGTGYYSASHRNQTKRVMQDRAFYIDDKIFLKDMSFFATVSSPSKLVGSQANCASTGQPPPQTVKNGVSLRPMNPKRVYR